MPTAKGTYPRGSSQGDIDKLLGALQAIANDSGFVVPEGMAVELLHLAQSGADFGAVCRYMDASIAKIILSQTMTTDNGSSRSQGEVHADVKLEVVKADADLLSDSFNTGPARWFTDLNFGADVAAPNVVRIVEEEDDLKDAADTDEVLTRVGWRRTEESFKDRFGDGYERADLRRRDGVSWKTLSSLLASDRGRPALARLVELRPPGQLRAPYHSFFLLSPAGAAFLQARRCASRSIRCRARTPTLRTAARQTGRATRSAEAPSTSQHEVIQ